MTFQSDTEQNNVMSNLTEQPPIELSFKPLPEQWRIRDLLIFLLYGLLSLLVANVLVFVGYAVLRPLFHWAIPIQKLQTNVTFILTLQLVWYVLLFAYIYLFIRLYYKTPFLGALKWKKLSFHNTVRCLLGGAALSLARAVVRRAERRMTELFTLEELTNPELLRYINRLSSLCFVLELLENQAAGRSTSLAKE